jgi:hypothetical protein
MNLRSLCPVVVMLAVAAHVPLAGQDYKFQPM